MKRAICSLIALALLPAAPAAALEAFRDFEIYVQGYSAGFEVASSPAPRRPASTPPAPQVRKAIARTDGVTRRVERDARLTAYRGLASWIDIFDRGPWRHPLRTVARMHRKGVRTIFIQTSTYGIRPDIFRGKVLGRFLKAAHRRDMHVVGWYVPSFAHPRRDLRRSLRGLSFTKKGHSFDSFALDIEVDIVDSIRKRNKRLLALATRGRRAAGPAFPLGAITPDPCCSLYWPDFPYRSLARRFDVFVPMGYFTFRASGYKATRWYTARNIKIIRERTGDAHIPIHMIGGIADDASAREVEGFVRAVRRYKAIGASLYDYPITGRTDWSRLSALSRAARRGRAAKG